MIRTAIYVNYTDIISSDYKIDVFRIPNVIIDYLFDATARQCDVTRTYVFMPEIAESQKTFVTALIGSHMDPIISREYIKSTTSEMLCKIVSDAYKNVFDLAVIVSGDSEIAPAILESRSLGKKVMLSYFSDRISRTYKDGHISLDYDMLYLDRFLDIIAVQTGYDEISTESVIAELEDEFLGGNVNYDSINMKKYLTYWVTRARFLQEQKTDEEATRELLKKTFEKCNELSNQYKPGYIKAMNRGWAPEDDWIHEAKRIPKTW